MSASSFEPTSRRGHPDRLRSAAGPASRLPAPRPFVTEEPGEPPLGTGLAAAGLPGRPLAPDLRTQMERSFGRDLSEVRVAEDPTVASRGALAYTRGPQIRFTPGFFRPADPVGRRVLAHELAHVLQQRDGRVAATGRTAGLPVNDSPHLEAEADAAAVRVARGERLVGSAVPGPPPGSTRSTAGGATPAQRLDWKKWGLGALTAGGAVAGGFAAAAAGATAAPIALAAAGGGLLAGGLGYGAHRAYRYFNPSPAARPPAEERLERWRQRGATREARGRIESGRYRTAGGDVTLSGMFGQRMAQARQDEYGGETFGSLPPYSGVRRDLPEEGLRAIHDPSYRPSSTLTHRQRLATSLGTTLSNASEPDRIDGYDKLVRALARRRTHEPTAPHPFDPRVNPAVSTAPEARSLMSGATPLNPDQRRAIDDYASESSDEDDERAAVRKGLLKRL